MHDGLDLRVIDRHHEADPRYREELRRRLQTILDGTDVDPADGAAPQLARSAGLAAPTAEPERHRRRWVAGAAAIVGVAATVVGLILLPSRDDPHPPASASVPPTDASPDDTVPTDAPTASTTPVVPDLFPELAPGGRIDLPAAPIGARHFGGGVWTGTELIVWGGFDNDGFRSADGAAFDPTTGTWRLIAPAPIVDRSEPSLVWTGTEVLVWGGSLGDDVTAHDGAAYDPATDSWRGLPPAPVTLDRVPPRQLMTWTGEEALVIGEQAAAYDPATDSWRQLASPPLPPHILAWAGDTIVAANETTLMVYDLAADHWSVDEISPQAALVAVPAEDGRIIAVPRAIGDPVQLIDDHGNPVAELPAFPGDPSLFGESIGASGWWVGGEVLFWIWAGEFPHEPEELWALNLTDRTWRRVDAAPMIEPSVAVAGDVLLAWGGGGPRGAPPDATGVVAYRASSAAEPAFGDGR